MGTYLSTPVTDKCEESGESLDCPDVPCAWGVVDMQGWRKSMEDAHTAVTDITLPNKQQEGEAMCTSDAKVFGVFDGHGGPEVARFCQLYLVSVLLKQSEWQNEELPTSPDSDQLPNPDDLEACAATPVGKALRSAFHALDRMIDDPERREEIIQLRNVKPLVGERKEAGDIPSIQDISHIQAPDFYTQSYSTSTDIAPVENAENDDGENREAADTTEVNNTAETEQHEALVESGVDTEEEASKESEANEDNAPNDDDKKELESNEASTDNTKDDDSHEAVGKDEALELDRDMMDEGDHTSERDGEASSEEGGNATKVTTMFQKILQLGGGAGQAVMDVGGEPATEPSQSDMSGPNARQPTMVHQGRMICNLPDHPIHAGATAIVAVVTGRILTVANAGDSRAVLGRANGATFALSFDHKPQQDREMTRITHSGGFVNHFGRVNGNLNLSRSIGDLKYKQVPGIPPADQMITAEPDIMQVALLPDDEFIILGCDGIWDCLTNEQAVEYVRDRIDTRTPNEIGAEMLDQIISDDPRVTQGIGGDNMTIMIIDLQPKSRSWRKEAAARATTVSTDTETETDAPSASPVNSSIA